MSIGSVVGVDRNEYLRLLRSIVLSLVGASIVKRNSTCFGSSISSLDNLSFDSRTINPIPQEYVNLYAVAMIPSRCRSILIGTPPPPQIVTKGGVRSPRILHVFPSGTQYRSPLSSFLITNLAMGLEVVWPALLVEGSGSRDRSSKKRTLQQVRSNGLCVSLRLVSIQSLSGLIYLAKMKVALALSFIVSAAAFSQVRTSGARA